MAVEVERLNKFYDSFHALKDVSFNVNSGEIYGLIGPNGAGKTTTLRIIATLLLPSSGVVKVFGMDVVSDADKVRRIISYLPEEAGAYKYLT
ncbi:MAG: ATP-binding cassette domain-containing protein, partial [archaeon YNP-WB-062]|nr:ATP-binding cassette domain-containing protein [Candidatus Culexarchaeum yellowstonense]